MARRAPMTASGDDQPTRKRRRLVPKRIITGVAAVISAVVLAVFSSGCQAPSTGPGPAASAPSAASSQSAAPSPGPYKVTATVPLDKHPNEVAVDPGTHTV